MISKPNRPMKRSAKKYHAWLDKVDKPYSQNANFYHSLGMIFSTLSFLSAELRFSVEPFHPLPAAVRDAFGIEQLKAAEVDDARITFGLSTQF
jgi:hypothetical protein